MTKWIALSLVAIGCGAQPPELPSCRLLLAPDAEAAEAVVAAAARWEAASGCALRVTEFGVPVRVVDQTYNAEGVAVHGGTFMSHDLGEGTSWPEHIEITRDTGEVSRETVALHEFGHALRVVTGHAPSGLMSMTGADEIDAESLAFVCEEAECPAFRPED